MPVVNFDYTSNLNIKNKVKEFLPEVHSTLVKLIQTDLHACRSTIQEHQDYLVGNGDANNGFMQMSIRILPGRTDEQKSILGNNLLKKLKDIFSQEINNFNVQCRVYITEVDKPQYYGLGLD